MRGKTKKRAGIKPISEYRKEIYKKHLIKPESKEIQDIIGKVMEKKTNNNAIQYVVSIPKEFAHQIDLNKKTHHVRFSIDRKHVRGKPEYELTAKFEKIK